jgi:PPM family protein phosphatase
MQEIQILNVVTGLVILALAAWVARVLATAPREGAPPRLAPAGAASDPVAALPNFVHDDEEEPTGQHALVLVTAVGRSDPGEERETGEDAYLVLDETHLLAIADGLGRHAASDVASRLAIEAIEEAFRKGTHPDPPPPDDAKLPKRASRLRDALVYANQRIWKRSREVAKYEGMGTTVVAAHFSPNEQKVYLAQVGDGRCYRLRGGALTQLTFDHIAGRSADVLGRALGVEETVKVDILTESPKPGDVYLLCSDRLTRMLDDEAIEKTLVDNDDLARAAAKLVEQANAKEGKSEVTAVLARVAAVPGPS